jgi:2-polyprenyl-3-methyl-5-hydroxy-6-metoxy-1,4-benzoquinol methylase
VDGNTTYRAGAIDTLGIAPTDRYDIVRCGHCGFVYARELPDTRFLARLYGEVIDPRVEDGTPAARGWIAHQLRLASALVARVAAASEPRVLDYGCGDGTILRALNAAGIACLGYEPYARADDARITDSLPSVKAAGPFAGIILSDVLEHVPSPVTVLQECFDLLAPAGWLVASVPDFSGARLRSIVRDQSAGRPVTRELNPWEHLNYFSPESLTTMVEEAGFLVERAPAENFGFRASTTGVRRMTNALRSAGRMLRFAVHATAGTTTIFAQK